MKVLILNILRYIFAIPLAFIAAILGSLFLPYVFVAYIPVGSIMYDIVWFISSNIAFVLLPLLVLYVFWVANYIRRIVVKVQMQY